jgi:peptidoglycan/xylan/chitin deacetylase (PgdA/CDA1 family)
MMEIKPLHSGIWDCYEDCIHSILNTYDIKPIGMYANAWCFYSLPREGELVQHTLAQKRVKLELLARQYGYIFQTKCCQNVQEFIDLCDQHDGVIIGTDMYELPWSDYYKTTHAPHACIITRYDHSKKRFAVVDATIMKTDIYLDHNFFTADIECEIMKKYNKLEPYSDEALLKESLLGYHRYSQQNNAFLDMKEYGTKIIEELIQRKVLVHYADHLMDSEVLLHLLFISRDRLTYAQWLECIGAESGITYMLEAGNKLREIGLKWMSIRTKIMRGLYQCTQDNYSELIKINPIIENDFFQLSEEEEKLHEILSKQKKWSQKTERKQDNNDFKYQYSRKDINLKPYLNAQAFYQKNGTNISTGFDGEGYFYIKKPLCSETFDHLECCGQIITFAPVECSAIRLSASSVKGNVIEDMKVICQDGSAETIHVRFSDWWESTPLCGEHIAWQGKCGRLENGLLRTAGDVSIFFDTYWWTKKKTIKALQLPNNSQLHIFRIETMVMQPRIPILELEQLKAILPKNQHSYWENWKKRTALLVDRDLGPMIWTNGIAKRSVTLAFDDAPDRYITPQILDVLKYYKVKASFSIVGCYLEKTQDILARIFYEGHEVVNHTFNHPYLSKLEQEEIRAEIIRTEIEIDHIIGKKPIFIRPPHGDINREAAKVVQSLGMEILLWSLNSFDWMAKDKDDILPALLRVIRDGEIILMHSYEEKEATLACLPELIEFLIKNNFGIIPAGQILDMECYKK